MTPPTQRPHRSLRPKTFQSPPQAQAEGQTSGFQRQLSSYQLSRRRPKQAQPNAYFLCVAIIRAIASSARLVQVRDMPSGPTPRKGRPMKTPTTARMKPTADNTMSTHTRFRTVNLPSLVKSMASLDHAVGKNSPSHSPMILTKTRFLRLPSNSP
jgi:hypothetical protein